MSSCGHDDAAWAVLIDDRLGASEEYPITECCTRCFTEAFGRAPHGTEPEQPENRSMTRDEAFEIVLCYAEDEGPEDRAEAVDLFRAIMGCEPDAEWDQGEIFSHTCVAVTAANRAAANGAAEPAPADD